MLHFSKKSNNYDYPDDQIEHQENSEHPLTMRLFRRNFASCVPSCLSDNLKELILYDPMIKTLVFQDVVSYTWLKRIFNNIK